jgi:ubiquinone/menaquinone biosynthesis C-methylase UbiE
MDESVPLTTDPAEGRDANAIYSLGRNQRESARLVSQADELAPESAALLDRVDPRPGQSAIDLGCGPRGVLAMLARRVAPSGRVVGVDADPAHVAMATQHIGEQDLHHVEVIVADARHTGLPSDSFDLVHARTLLVNIPDPEEVVAEMVRLARPGGHVVALEPDTEYALCYPPHPAFERICRLFSIVFSRNGADPSIGRRVPELFRAAGLEDVDTAATAKLYPHGHSRRTIRLDLLRSMHPHIVEMGLANQPELDELDAAARSHLDDPHTLVMPSLAFATSGRKAVGSRS